MHLLHHRGYTGKDIDDITLEEAVKRGLVSGPIEKVINDGGAGQNADNIDLSYRKDVEFGVHYDVLDPEGKKSAEKS